ncbi:MAG: hypothetical protein H6644_20815 [Caldilineaceae bacterium]|nr:hypothetical protein [Caldilineaceae bacterium]
MGISPACARAHLAARALRFQRAAGRVPQATDTTYLHRLTDANPRALLPAVRPWTTPLHATSWPTTT